MSLKNHDWRKIVKTLSHFGYVPVRQSGGHIILRNSKGMIVSVPRYDPLPEGTKSNSVRSRNQKRGFHKKVVVNEKCDF
ncbi:MAG TPA: type II toxin-antitoxin system HicA family toxin [Candidatus Nitrosotenuis sp.]